MCLCDDGHELIACHFIPAEKVSLCPTPPVTETKLAICDSSTAPPGVMAPTAPPGVTAPMAPPGVTAPTAPQLWVGTAMALRGGAHTLPCCATCCLLTGLRTAELGRDANRGSSGDVRLVSTSSFLTNIVRTELSDGKTCPCSGRSGERHPDAVYCVNCQAYVRTLRGVPRRARPWDFHPVSQSLIT